MLSCDRAPAVGWEALCRVFSVALLVDESLTVQRRSSMVEKRMPALAVGEKLTDHLSFHRPARIATADEIRRKARGVVLLKAHTGDFALRGQFVEACDGTLLFLGAPWLSWMQRHAEHVALSLADFAPADVQLDQLFYMSTEKEMVADLERLTAELTVANEAVEAATRSKSAFFALMSHELRTPLNGVITGLSLLEDLELTSEQAQLARTVHGSARTMLSVINNVLDFSRLEAGHLAVEPTHFDIAELIDSVLEIHAMRAQRQAVKLEQHIAADALGHWHGDDAKLRQILINIVSNAVSFTSEGRVAIDVNRTTDGLRFDIVDTGSGIPPENKTRVFEPYFSWGRDGGTMEGSGLGLDMVRRLVELLGGTIDFTSEVGLGTRFWFEVPLERSGAADVPSRAPEKPEVKRLSGRVLLVEDNAVNSLLGRRMLEKYGLIVESASDGAEAVEMCTRLHFDLVLMDISMPVLDGVGATKQISQYLGSNAPPIVALTAHAGEDERARFLAAGMVDHLVKPVTSAKLGGVLGRYLTLADEAAAVGEATQTYSMRGFDPRVLHDLAAEIGLDNVSRVHELFESDLARRVDAIEEAGARCDWPRLAAECHALRSSAQSVGATGFAQRLQRLELAVKEARYGELATDLAGLGEDARQANELIRQELASA